MSLWKRTTSITWWLFQNGVMYGLMALGFLTGFGWAWNLYAFIAWLATFGFWAMALAKKKALEDGNEDTLDVYRKFNHPTHIVLDYILDGVALVALVAMGHWFYGLLKILEIAGYRAFYLKPIPPRSSAEGTSVS